jgi:hypothetical protein
MAVSPSDSSARAPVAAKAAAAPNDTAKKQQAAVSLQAAPVSVAKDSSHAPVSSATVAPAASAKPAAAQKKKPVEEDLYEEMLLPEEGAPQPAAAPAPQAIPRPEGTPAMSVSAPQKQADSTKVAAPIAAPAAAVPVADTGKSAHVLAPVAPSVQILPVDTLKKQAEIAKPAAPAKVEAAKSINFARGVKEYRSPKLAMLLSLLVPGLGQAYVKSYVKAGLFFAADVAIISTSVAFSTIGKNQYNQATAFADRNYSVSKMSSYYNGLYSFMLGSNMYGDSASADTAINAIYADSLKSFIQGSKVKSSSYYQTLSDQGASNPYVQGWNDCQPTIAQIANANDEPISGSKYNYTPYDTLELNYLVQLHNKNTNNPVGVPVYGYSDSMLAYQKMMAQSSDNTKIAMTVLFVLILNHVVSAVDALITANAYNDELLGKQSFWHHVNLEPTVAGSGFQIGPALSLRLQF